MLKVLSVVSVAVVIMLMTGCTAQETVAPPPEPVSTASSPQETNEEGLFATGVYTGQIDNNSIEIKINGRTEDNGYRAFALSEGVRASFDRMELNPNEPVKIRYLEREGQQPLLLSIDRTK
ncbi:MAG: hypothetical protein BWY15_01839 [Firmicutes bacterium ADurb.Bin193]|nr:MAG: hypothetical protein BWY15_01839 [Firmicutes bacterium ADurb.Bin193]